MMKRTRRKQSLSDDLRLVQRFFVARCCMLTTVSSLLAIAIVTLQPTLTMANGRAGHSNMLLYHRSYQPTIDDQHLVMRRPFESTNNEFARGGAADSSVNSPEDSVISSGGDGVAASNIDSQDDRVASESEEASLSSSGEPANQDDEPADSSNEQPDTRNVFMNQHNSRLQAMHDLFERRQLNNHHHHNQHHNQNHNPLQSSQELNPISIGLDPVSGAGPPFNMVPFGVGPDGGPPPSMGHPKPQMGSNADNLDQGLGPALPFGLGPLPHLLGFQNAPFDGPQRGDQSAHSNHHAVSPSTDSEVGVQPKVWPKIFRFTDGRINLSDFEKQKKIRLSNKNQHNTDNHIESAPIMFDGRPLKRKSFLILHGGIFSKR